MGNTIKNLKILKLARSRLQETWRNKREGQATVQFMYTKKYNELWFQVRSELLDTSVGPLHTNLHQRSQKSAHLQDQSHPDNCIIFLNSTQLNLDACLSISAEIKFNASEQFKQRQQQNENSEVLKNLMCFAEQLKLLLKSDFFTMFFE